jgi:hypothetical protein
VARIIKSFFIVCILTFPLIVWKKAAATQVFQQFALVGSLGLGTTSIDHSLHNYVVLCYAPNGPVHPTSASIYSGCSLAFVFLLLQGNSFFVAGGTRCCPSFLAEKISHHIKEFTNNDLPSLRKFICHVKYLTSSDCPSLLFRCVQGFFRRIKEFNHQCDSFISLSESFTIEKRT